MRCSLYDNCKCVTPRKITSVKTSTLDQGASWNRGHAYIITYTRARMLLLHKQQLNETHGAKLSERNNPERMWLNKEHFIFMAGNCGCVCIYGATTERDGWLDMFFRPTQYHTYIPHACLYIVSYSYIGLSLIYLALSMLACLCMITPLELCYRSLWNSMIIW